MNNNEEKDTVRARTKFPVVINTRHPSVEKDEKAFPIARIIPKGTEVRIRRITPERWCECTTVVDDIAVTLPDDALDTSEWMGEQYGRAPCSEGQPQEMPKGGPVTPDIREARTDFAQAVINGEQPVPPLTVNTNFAKVLGDMPPNPIVEELNRQVARISAEAGRVWETRVMQLESEAVALRRELGDLRAEKDALQASDGMLRKTLLVSRNDRVANEDKIRELRVRIAELERDLDAFQREDARLNQVVQYQKGLLESQGRSLNAVIDEQKDRLREKDGRLNEMTAKLDVKEARLNDLRASLDAVNDSSFGTLLQKYNDLKALLAKTIYSAQVEVSGRKYGRQEIKNLIASEAKALSLWQEAEARFMWEQKRSARLVTVNGVVYSAEQVKAVFDQKGYVEAQWKDQRRINEKLQLKLNLANRKIRSIRAVAAKQEGEDE